MAPNKGPGAEKQTLGYAVHLWVIAQDSARPLAFKQRHRISQDTGGERRRLRKHGPVCSLGGHP